MILHLLAFLAGAFIVIATLLSAVRTFVVPRGIPDRLTRVVFLSIRAAFELRIRRSRDFIQKDSVLALFAPYSLLALPATWLALVLIGYALMFWSILGTGFDRAVMTSGSSLFGVGIGGLDHVGQAVLGFSEAAIGLSLLALLIAYLPTMYGAFQRRESSVTMLETQAGSPPSALKFIVRFHRIQALDKLRDEWPAWRAWFADISESHTSLSSLVFYRSPRADRSWVTAAGAVLDTAALVASTLDMPRDPEAELCLRSGYLALQRISDMFPIQYDPNPHWPETPISVSRDEFDAACDRFHKEGVPLKADREQAWTGFAGWRVNYDAVLLALASLTVAPIAPWSSDRAPRWIRTWYFRRGLSPISPEDR